MSKPQTTLDELLDKCEKALSNYIETDETYEGDEPLPDHGGLTWDEINEDFLKIKHDAEDAVLLIRKYRSKKHD